MANVLKRGSTWTYYVYVTDGDGRRRQITKGGFPTRRDAEHARIEALAAQQQGTFVRPERVTVREYLMDEWLPTQRPPTLEESTHRSYERYLRIHVVPYVGGIALQQLTPMDLNGIYRHLLDAGRRHPVPPGRLHDQTMIDRVNRLKAKGLTWQQIADAVAAEVPEEAGISRHAVAALYRRNAKPSPKRRTEPGLKPRTVRYVHTILHAALRDAMRWNRVARNVANAANPRRLDRPATASRSTGAPSSSGPSSTSSLTTATSRPGCSSPPPAAAEVRRSA